MSCAVTRTLWPERRTLPSSTVPTFNLRAIVPMSVSFPLNEKADVRAATCSSLMRDRELRSSSVRPSEKYSWLGSPLMFRNGNTAMEWGGGAKETAPAGATFAGDPEYRGPTTRNQMIHAATVSSVSPRVAQRQL